MSDSILGDMVGYAGDSINTFARSFVRSAVNTVSFGVVQNAVDVPTALKKEHGVADALGNAAGWVAGAAPWTMLALSAVPAVTTAGAASAGLGARFVAPLVRAARSLRSILPGRAAGPTASEIYSREMQAMGITHPTPELQAAVYNAAVSAAAPTKFRALGVEFPLNSWWTKGMLAAAPLIYAANTQQGVGGYVHQLGLPRFIAKGMDIVMFGSGTNTVLWDKASVERRKGATSLALTEAGQPSSLLQDKPQDIRVDRPHSISSAYVVMSKLSDALNDKLNWPGIDKHNLIAEIVKAERDGSLQSKLNSVRAAGLPEAQSAQLARLADAAGVYLHYQQSLSKLEPESLERIRKQNPEWLLGMDDSLQYVAETRRDLSSGRKNLAELRRGINNGSSQNASQDNSSGRMHKLHTFQSNYEPTA